MGVDYLTLLKDKKNNKEIIEKLEKEELEYKIEEEKRKIREEVLSKNKDVAKIVEKFSSKEELAEMILEVIPLYYDEAGLWWMWHSGSHRWVLCDEVDICNIVMNTSTANTISQKERNEILQALKQVSRYNKPIEPSPELIQFGDEVVNIFTGDRFKASPKYFFTNPIPHKIGKSKETPTIDKLLKDWVGEKYVNTMKEIIAYCLYRDMPIHRTFCFIGSGSNGKSCFLDMLATFLGNENCSTTDFERLMTNRFETTRIYRKLACIMGETNFEKLEKTDLFKRMTGGDLISFEYKHKKPFEAKSYAKIIIATNNLPETTDKTDGFYRRWLIIDFPNKFTEGKNPLLDITEEEYENLAYACIDILYNLLKKYKFEEEGTVEERAKVYEEKSNPFEKFWKEFIVEDIEKATPKFMFREAFEEFCRENKFRMPTEVFIAKKMREKGIREVRRTFKSRSGDTKVWRAWEGIVVKGLDVDEDDGFSTDVEKIKI